MKEELKRKAAEAINGHILTPVIYMVEDEGGAEFICFCDNNITAAEFAAAEGELNNIFDNDVAVTDIRAYCEADRLNIIHNGELIYTANAAFERIFEISMSEDYRRMAIEKEELLKRYDASGSVYLQ